MRMFLCALTCSVMLPASAGEMDAFALGYLIGSDKACELKLNQDAIVAWIGEAPEAADANFGSLMNAAIGMMERKIPTFSPIQRAAHCAQMARVAKDFQFAR